MAKFEFQLSATKALNALKKMDQGIERLRTTIDAFNANTTGLDKLSTKLNNFKGINSQAINSIKELTKSLRGLPTSAKIANINKALINLSNIKVERLSASITRINRELAKIHVPPALRQLGSVFKQIETHANRTAKSITTVAKSLNTIKAPQALGQANSQLMSFNSSLARSSAAMRGFGGSISTVSSVLAGFGIALGAVGFSQFVAQAKEAVFTIDRFITVTQALKSRGADAAQSLEFINRVANQTATDVGVLAGAFGKFSAAALNSKFTVDQTQKVFAQMAGVMRVLNLSAPDARLAFLALEQMISKGKVSMEELRRQLGERIPGAFGIMARALGVSAAKLEKMVTSGKVGSQAVIKFAEQASREFGGGLTAALAKPQAALSFLTNSFFRLRESFGRGLFEQLMPGLKEFTNAVSSGELRDVFRNMGETLGRISSDFLTFISQNGPAIQRTFNSIASTIASVSSFIANNAEILKTAFVALLAVKVVGFIGGIAAGLVTMSTAIAGAVTGMVAFLGPIGAVAAAIAGATAVFFGISKATDAMRSSQEAATASANSLNETTKRISNEKHKELQLLILSARRRQEEINSINRELRAKEEAVQLTRRQALETQLAVQLKQEELASLRSSGQATQENVIAIQQEIQAKQQSVEALRQKMETERQSLETFKASISATDDMKNKAAEHLLVQARQIELSGQHSQVIDTLQKRNFVLTGEWRKQADALMKTSEATQDASANTKELVNAQSQVGAASRQMNPVISVIDRITSAAGRATSALLRMASALASTKAADSEGGSSSSPSSTVTGRTGSGSGLFGGFRQGGIVAHGSNEMIRAKQSVFKNAPQFNTGVANTNSVGASLPGGGIPSILHPNEAVIPLGNGGTVPVQMNMGGNARMIPLLVKNLVVNREIKQEIAVARENIKQQTVILNDGIRNVANGIDVMIDWQVETLKELNSIRSSGISGGSSSSSSSLSSSASPSGGRLGAGADVELAQANLESLLRSAGPTGIEAKDFQRGDLIKGGIDSFGLQATFEKLLSEERFAQQNAFLDAQLDFARNFGTAEDIARAQDLVNRKNEFKAVHGGIQPVLNLGFFAKGSPNASKEMQGGGFPAILHPNEAVIPLPDGRRVPVDLNTNSIQSGIQETVDRMEDLSNSFLMFARNLQNKVEDAANHVDNSSSGSNDKPNVTKNVNIKLDMHVSTPDANSFRQSENQIMQALQTKLNEANRAVGTIPQVEDPTKRVE